MIEHTMTTFEIARLVTLAYLVGGLTVWIIVDYYNDKKSQTQTKETK